jgi:lysophospholipase L1-like esterase
MMIKSSLKMISALAFGFVLLSAIADSERPALRQGDKIVFLGDSITVGGMHAKGYISLIRRALETHVPELSVEAIASGGNGHMVRHLQGRLQRDVIARNPTIVFVYIGINDVWRRRQMDDGSIGGGTSEEDFEAGLRKIISRIQAAGARTFLCTPSVIGEKADGQNERDELLERYSAISRRVALETGSQLVDLRKAFIAYLKINNPENKDRGILTRDAVHLNAAGNRLVAEKMLEALGLTLPPDA